MSKKEAECLFYNRLIYEKEIVAAISHSDLEDGYTNHYREYRKSVLYGFENDEYSKNKVKIIN